MVQPIFPGINLRDAIYELSGEEGLEVVSGKKNLTDIEKEIIATGILHEYDILQKLNAVHADIKPDNFLYDKASGTVKLIDMGQAFDGTKESPHEIFAAPGVTYTPPERHNNVELKNSSKADLYNVAIIIASLYSQNCFERDANTGDFGENGALKARECLNDVLDPAIQAVKGMPNALLKMVQHLAETNPNNRAQNIALANGASHYHTITNISQSQQRAMLQLNEIKVMTDKAMKNRPEGDSVRNQVKMAVNNNLDLSTIANDLSRIARENASDKKLNRLVTDVIKKIDRFNTHEARALQTIRAEAVEKPKNIQSYSQSLQHIARMLNNVANEHRLGGQGGIFLMQSPPGNASQFDDIGKLFSFMARTVAAQTKPEDVDITLKALSEKIKQMEPNKFAQGENERKALLSIIEEASETHAAVKPKEEKISKKSFSKS